MASSNTCVYIMVPCVVLLAGLMVSAEARIALPTSDYNLVDGSSSNSGSGLGARGGQSAGAETVSAESSDEVSGSSMPWALGAIRVMRKVYLECQDEDFTSCLKVQFIRAMDKVAANIKEVPLMAGMSLERDPEFHAEEKMLSKDELEATLPRSLPDRERSLDKLIMDRVVSFFKNYSLRFKLPAITDVSTGEEARRRRQPPMGGMVGLLALLAGSLLPMKFGMLAMLAGKALMLSKLALIISALMAMRNMGNNNSSSGAAVH